MIEPWWPLAVLAAIQLADAVLCIKPAAFIQACLESVRFPQRFAWVFPPIKFAAAAGLVAGVWFPPLAVLTAGALTVYFVLAAGAHIRVRDFGRNFASSLGMLAICAAVFAFTLAVV